MEYYAIVSVEISKEDKKTVVHVTIGGEYTSQPTEYDLSEIIKTYINNSSLSYKILSVTTINSDQYTKFFNGQIADFIHQSE